METYDHDIAKMSIPHDILDEIYKCCDIGTKVLIRRICKFFHQRYEKFKCPFNNPQVVKLLYNGDVVRVGNIAINNKVSRMTKIMNFHSILVNKYKLNEEDVVRFNVVIGEKYYKCAISSIIYPNAKRYSSQDTCITVNGKTYLWANFMEKYVYSKYKKNARKFTLIDENYQCKGTYKGCVPMKAAKRAFTQLMKKNILGPKQDVPFMIKEITQGCGGKIYRYTGTQVQINPKQVMLRLRHLPGVVGPLPNFAVKMVTFDHTNVITKVPKLIQLRDGE